VQLYKKCYYLHMKKNNIYPLENSLEAPILFLIYNRPEITKTTFAQICKIKPANLFIAADGPKANDPSDKKKCEDTRNILSQINWECNIKTLFREKNLGYGKAISSSINWFFEHIDAGIILEDDCFPDITFFNFCSELLDYYKSNEQIMMISGDNFQDNIKRGDSSYYFSKYCHVWGWATWKRAWKHYAFNMQRFPDFIKRKTMNTIFSDINMRNRWKDIFYDIYKNKIDTWDYQWVYAIFNNNGLSIIPNLNLVSNIGFGQQATHTTDGSDPYAARQCQSISEITHPTSIKLDVEADKYTFYKNYTSPSPSFIKKLRQTIKNSLRDLILTHEAI